MVSSSGHGDVPGHRLLPLLPAPLPVLRGQHVVLGQHLEELPLPDEGGLVVLGAVAVLHVHLVEEPVDPCFEADEPVGPVEGEVGNVVGVAGGLLQAVTRHPGGQEDQAPQCSPLVPLLTEVHSENLGEDALEEHGGADDEEESVVEHLHLAVMGRVAVGQEQHVVDGSPLGPHDEDGQQLAVDGADDGPAGPGKL